MRFPTHDATNNFRLYDAALVRRLGIDSSGGFEVALELTAKAFDDDGFYLIGDAVTFADPGRPERGLFFDGRVAEDFKLNSGTWVSVGTLRVAGIAALAPLAQDIVVTGHGGDQVRAAVEVVLTAIGAEYLMSEDLGPKLRDALEVGQPDEIEPKDPMLEQAWYRVHATVDYQRSELDEARIDPAE